MSNTKIKAVVWLSRSRLLSWPVYIIKRSAVTYISMNKGTRTIHTSSLMRLGQFLWRVFLCFSVVPLPFTCSAMQWIQSKCWHKAAAIWVTHPSCCLKIYILLLRKMTWDVIAYYGQYYPRAWDTFHLLVLLGLGFFFSCLCTASEGRAVGRENPEFQ